MRSRADRSRSCAGAASGGVAAIVAAIEAGSEEGVVWGAKRYSVDCSGVRVKGLAPDDVNLVQYAAERGYVRGAVVGVLVGLGVGVRGVVGRGGWTPLHHAANGGRVGVCGVLVGAGAELDAATSLGRTALHYAAYYGHTRVCELLVGHGASVGAVDGDGRTASDYAKAQGHAKLSERLKKMSEWGGVGQMRVRARTMEHAIEVAGDVGCGYGFAVVGVGIEGGSVDDVRRGIGEGGVDLNGNVWGAGWSSIDHAILCGNDVGVVSALIECGADVNGTTACVSGGGTYLHHAAVMGRSGVCSTLIAAGVDVNGVDEDGDRKSVV